MPSSLTTAQTLGAERLGDRLGPRGHGNLAGTVSFDLYAAANCTGTAIYSTTAAVAGASPQTVSTSNTTAQLATGSFSWKVSYDSTNAAQRNIPPSCHEIVGSDDHQRRHHQQPVNAK